jgi:starch synthase
MKVLLLTREYPPYVYGGAGVHVEYLSGELAKLMHVEVRSFGDQDTVREGVRVKGFPFGKGSFAHVDKKLSGALDTFETNLETLSEQVDADLVHVHTWYAHLGGILAKTLYGIPLVHTVHSLEPLRPWKREQLGCGYDMSSWIERTSLGMADAVIAVSQGTKDDILAHFDIDPAKITVIYNGINVEQYHPTEDTTALEKYGVDPQADRPLRWPDHAPEGHRASGQCGPVHQPRPPRSCSVPAHPIPGRYSPRWNPRSGTFAMKVSTT